MQNQVVIKLDGIPPSKKNSKVMSFKGERPHIFSSESYLLWEQTQSWMIIKHKNKRYAVKEISVKFFRENNRKFDLTNKIESINDLFVKNKVIEDDDWSHLPIIHIAIGEKVSRAYTEIIFLL